tara:strand:- start:19173 stop:19730 length:558 start_codon:yes stop_codon:yes gene_type:complete
MLHLLKSPLPTILLTISLLFFGGCKDNSLNSDDDFLLTTNIGNKISLDGHWGTGSVVDNGNVLYERFSFSENTFEIFAEFYSDSSCNQSVGTVTINIEFEVDGTHNVVFNGQEVSANKISGKQIIGPEEKQFKQSIYIIEDGDDISFYHTRFPDDGGTVSSDGYPNEIVPIPFSPLILYTTNSGN